ncbi:c-type cytochrome domain-containing protein, partial [Salmonella sp. SAL4355]|uniref:c-type cytochrome domain-containing protein n=1 Tax=Salmonella sp. SAL4355 TaxID=3159876 RepID=UPI0039790D56
AVSLAVGHCLAASFTAERAKPSGRDTARQAIQILKAECFACHNEEKKKGGLVLTSREFLLKGNDDGIVVAPGKPDSSRL